MLYMKIQCSSSFQRTCMGVKGITEFEEGVLLPGVESGAEAEVFGT